MVPRWYSHDAHLVTKRSWEIKLTATTTNGSAGEPVALAPRMYKWVNVVCHFAEFFGKGFFLRGPKLEKSPVNEEGGIDR